MTRGIVTSLLLSLLGLGGCLDSGDGAPPGSPTLDGSGGGAAGLPTRADAGFAIDPQEPLDTRGDEYACSAGVIDVATGIDFAQLDPGGAIPIGGTGQAGLTARMALRLDSGSDPGESVIDLVLTNALDGTPGQSVLADRPVRFDCRSDGFCYVAPVLVEISHLAKLPELEGLTVRVDVTVLDAGDSTRVLCRARNHGVLQRVR